MSSLNRVNNDDSLMYYDYQAGIAVKLNASVENAKTAKEKYELCEQVMRTPYLDVDTMLILLDKQNVDEKIMSHIIKRYKNIRTDLVNLLIEQILNGVVAPITSFGYILNPYEGRTIIPWQSDTYLWMDNEGFPINWFPVNMVNMYGSRIFHIMKQVFNVDHTGCKIFRRRKCNMYAYVFISNKKQSEKATMICAVKLNNGSPDFSQPVNLVNIFALIYHITSFDVPFKGCDLRPFVEKYTERYNDILKIIKISERCKDDFNLQIEIKKLQQDMFG